MVQRELATFLWGSSANMDTFVRQWEEPVPIPPLKQTNKRIHKDFSPIVTTHVNNHVVNRKRVIYSILFPSFFFRCSSLSKKNTNAKVSSGSSSTLASICNQQLILLKRQVQSIYLQLLTYYELVGKKIFHLFFTSVLSKHHGSKSCGDFKRGVQNQKDFCLRINIVKENY